MKRIIVFTLLILASFLLIAYCTGCASSRIAPGHTASQIGDVKASAVQSESPQAATTQTIETDTVTRQAVTGPGTVTTAASQIPVEITTHKKITTTIGAAQKDLSQEITAKLASVRWLQWLGVAVALFGIASMTYPPLRLIVASVTTSAWCIGAGAAMVFLPLVIVGHEILILGVAGGLVGLWFLAHRHGSISGELKSLKSKL